MCGHGGDAQPEGAGPVPATPHLHTVHSTHHQPALQQTDTLYFLEIDIFTQKYVCLGEDHSIAEAVHIPGDREAVLVDRDAGAHVLRVEPQQILLLIIFLAAFIFISNLNCFAVLRFAKCKYFLNLCRLDIFNTC